MAMLSFGLTGTSVHAVVPVVSAINRERRVIHVWEQVLGAEEVAPDSDYFAHRLAPDLHKVAHSDPVRLFEQWAARRPDHPAICGADGTVLTYRELNRLSNRVARRLISAGVGPGVEVPVLADRGPGLVVGWLAVGKAGGAYVPIDTSAPRAHIDALIADVAANAATGEVLSVVLTAEEFGDGRPSKLDDDNPSRRPEPRHLAYVAYTPGSAGRPQGCGIERSNLAHILCWYCAEAGITSGDRLLQAVSPGFDAAVLEIWAALRSGATICFLPAMLTEPARLLCWMAEQEITVAFLPAPLAEIVLTDRAWPPGLRLRVLVTGGDRLRVRPPADAPFRVLSVYGPTECTVASIAAYIGPAPPDTIPDTIPDIGKPIAGTDIYLLDPRGAKVAVGQWGEICVGGDGVGRGYLGSPGLTATRFVADPFAGRPGARMYRTGDLARWVDGQLEIRGQRVEPAEVRRALTTRPLVREAVVVASVAPRGPARLLPAYPGETPERSSRTAFSTSGRSPLR
ncbi:MAG TPA: amino acid adenylation domain-containing protein [Streptosporangiaceae bacterium]